MPAALLALALLATPPASPEALYRAGADAYRAGRYEVAVTAFEAALGAADRPDLLFSLAQARRLAYFETGRVEHLEAAVRAYRAYLAQVPDGPRRAHATEHLSTLVPYLDRLQIERAEGEAAAGEAPARVIVTSAVADAVARLDDGPPQPVPAAFEVPAGAYRIRVDAEAHRPVEREVAAISGAAVAIALDPPPVPGTLRVGAPPGARVVIDGRAIGEGPLAGPVELAPGSHEVAVLARGHRPVVRPIALGRGEAARVDVELERTTQRWLAISALAAAGALSLGAGATGWLALDAQAEAEAIEGRVGAGLLAPELERYRDLEARRDLYRDAAIGLGVAATALLAAGLVAWVFDEPAAPAR